MPASSARTIHGTGTTVRQNVSAWPLLAAGAVGGLAWAASLRAFMAQISPVGSTVTWVGTFAWILLPGLVAGVLLAWAEHIRRRGGARGWRWLALSPLVFLSVLLPGLADPSTMFEGGLGGGAVGVPLFAIAGGYALSGRGPRGARIACGAAFLTIVPIWALTVTSFAGDALAVSTPRGAWVAIHYWSLMIVLALACSIPHRAAVAREAPRGA